MQRKNCDVEQFPLLRAIIQKIASKSTPPILIQLERKWLKDWIYETEKMSGEYYGDELSDDSDEEEIKTFSNKPMRVQHALLESANKMMGYGQVDLLMQKNEKKFLNPRHSKSSSSKSSDQSDPTSIGCYDLTARAKIHYPIAAIPDDVTRDLEDLNRLINDERLNRETIKAIVTKFVVAQYRGIQYEISKWSLEDRRQNRITNESNLPVYSEAVYKKSEVRINPIGQYSPTDLERLERAASLLKHQIYCLEHTGVITSKLIMNQRKNEGNLNFYNGAEALQEFYTRRYYDHKAHLLKIFNWKTSQTIIAKAIDVASLFSVGRDNYCISTSDTPNHAIKYSSGIKSYGEEGKDTRLRPRWRSTGKPERPYSGKVLTYLLDPVSLVNLHTRHLISMHYKQRLFVEETTLPERETTIPVSLPPNICVSQIVLKYPDFSNGFSHYHIHEYGMTEAFYNMFHQYLFENSTSGAHGIMRKDGKFLLGEHLGAYYEACLIEDARIIAQNQDAWLIYRDKSGEFSMALPRIQPVTSGKRKIAADEERAEQQRQKEIRQQSNQLEGLEKIMSEYSVLPGLNLYYVISKLCQLSEEEMNTANNASDRNTVEAKHMGALVEHAPERTGIVLKVYLDAIAFLIAVSRLKNIDFLLHSFIFTESVSIGDKTNTSTHYDLIYLGGDGFHGLISKQNIQPISTSSSSGASSLLVEKGSLSLSDDDLEPLSKRYKSEKEPVVENPNIMFQKGNGKEPTTNQDDDDDMRNVLF